MRTGHLFAGGGGGLLADLILGHKPVFAIELVKTCCDSLRARQQEGWIPDDLHIHCGDIQEFDFKPWAGKLDCVSAGFPCQDISVAGKGAGIEGERSGLVSEVFRAIDDIQPGIVWLENSPNIRTRGRHIVIRELVARGYAWKDGILGAVDVGAPHNRDRWWLIAANADGMRKLESQGSFREQWEWNCNGVETDQRTRRAQDTGQNTPNINKEHDDLGRLYAGSISQFEASRVPRVEENVTNTLQPGLQEFRGIGADETRTTETAYSHEAPSPDTLRQRLQVAVQCGGLQEASAAAIQAAAGYTGAYHWSPPDAGICGMVDGVATQLDGISKGARLKAAGNGQVPLAAAAAWIILSGVRI